MPPTSARIGFRNSWDRLQVHQPDSKWIRDPPHAPVERNYSTPRTPPDGLHRKDDYDIDAVQLQTQQHTRGDRRRGHRFTIEMSQQKIGRTIFMIRTIGLRPARRRFHSRDDSG